MLKVPFRLTCGLEYEGVLYRDGEMRMPNLEDQECALEETAMLMPDGNPCQARIDRHVWARTIVSLGKIPCEKITPELLAALPAYDFGVLTEAENTLKKKLQESKCYDSEAAYDL